MTINQINSGNFSENDIKKSKKPGSSKSANRPQPSERTSPNKAGQDRFSPSGTQLKGEFDLAATELNKLRDASFSSLKEIKKKISDGAYDSKEVHQKIGSLVEKNLQSLEKMLSKMPATEGIDSDKKSLSPEYKKYLIENPKVVQKVADQLAKDLKNI